ISALTSDRVACRDAFDKPGRRLPKKWARFGEYLCEAFPMRLGLPEPQAKTASIRCAGWHGRCKSRSARPRVFPPASETSMSTFDNPFDPARRLRAGCSCGGHASEEEHERAVSLAVQGAPVDTDTRFEGVVASAVMRAMFPRDAVRRAFLKGLGASTALAALSQFFPLKAASEAFAQAPGAIEKKDLKIGFIPITCATPIIMAHPMGFYAKHGLNVEVIKTAGWAVIRDKTLNKEYDAAHMLSPMPLAISLGVGSTPIPYTMPAVENINGQAITLAVKHKDKRDPKTWKGFKFAVPFDYSMHNYLLRYY